MTSTAEDPQVLQDRLNRFMDEHIYPNESAMEAHYRDADNPWVTAPLMEELKAQAREQGLWNLWLPAEFGGLSNEAYCALAEEIAFAERAMAACEPAPLYGRVDMIRDNDGALAVMELELVEPSLFLRHAPAAAGRLEDALLARISG